MLRACLAAIWSFAFVLIPQALPAAGQDAAGRYTVFVELREPYENNRVALRQRLKVEGYEAFPEGDRELALVLTARQIEKLFGARVGTRLVEKSATRGMALEPVLEGVRIPARFEKLIRSVYFDPQRG